MRFAKNVFRIAGAWGAAILAPLYFMFDWIGTQYPPAITHPDLYFGFIGLALAWQAAFLVIARDPVRFRPMMVAAMLEKFVYVFTVLALYAKGRLQAGELVVAGPDFVLGILFVAAFVKTSPPKLNTSGLMLPLEYLSH